MTTVPLCRADSSRREGATAALMNVRGYLPLPLELMMACNHGNLRNHTEGNGTGADFTGV